MTLTDFITEMLAAWRTYILSSIKAYDGIKFKIIILAVVVLAIVIEGTVGIGHVMRVTNLCSDGRLEYFKNIERAGWG